MTTKVQIAFQGGGARLTALLAACEVIHQLQNDNVIEVTRVAGTSAGSIAAVLVAAKADVSKLRDYLQKLDEKKISSAFPHLVKDAMFAKATVYAKVIPKLMVSRPIASMNPLGSLLHDALKIFDINPTGPLSQFGETRVFIVTADIKKGSKNVRKSDDQILDALMDSCALPFLFRTPRSAGNSTIVDGGLFDNLPAEELNSKPNDIEEFGEIIAISFKEDSYKASPENMIEFCKSLFDAIITQKTRSSKRIVGERNVIELETELHTFDTDKIVSLGLGDDYDHVKFKAKKKFEAWLDVRKESQADAYRKAVTSDSERLKLFADQIEELGHLNAPDISNRLQLCRMTVTANCLLPVEHPDHGDDKVEIMYRFVQGSKEIGSVPFYLTTNDSEIYERVTWGLSDAVGYSHKTLPFPIIRNDRRVVKSWVYFVPAIPPEGAGNPPYTATQTQHIKDFMLPLKNQGSDYLGFEVKYVELAEVMELVLFVPAEFDPLELTSYEPDGNESDGKPTWAAGMESRQFVEGARVSAYPEVPPDFISYTWRANDVGTDEFVGVCYTIQAR